MAAQRRQEEEDQPRRQASTSSAGHERPHEGEHQRQRPPIGRAQQGIAAFEQLLAGGGRQGQPAHHLEGSHVGQGRRVKRPVEALVTLVRAIAAGQELPRRKPLNGGQADGQDEGEGAEPQGPHGERPAPAGAVHPGKEEDPGEKGHEAGVSGAREDLQGGRGAEAQRTSGRGRLQELVEPDQDPGHPGRAGVVVEEAGRREKGTGEAVGEPRDQGGVGGQAAPTGQEEDADPSPGTMAGHQDLVVGGRSEDQVQPGRRIREGQTGVGKQGFTEPHIRVPEGEGALGHGPHEDLDVGSPVVEDVTLVEDPVGEQGGAERRDHRKQEHADANRPLSRHQTTTAGTRTRGRRTSTWVPRSCIVLTLMSPRCSFTMR